MSLAILMHTTYTHRRRADSRHREVYCMQTEGVKLRWKCSYIYWRSFFFSSFPPLFLLHPFPLLHPLPPRHNSLIYIKRPRKTPRFDATCVTSNTISSGINFFASIGGNKPESLLFKARLYVLKSSSFQRKIQGKLHEKLQKTARSDKIKTPIPSLTSYCEFGTTLRSCVAQGLCYCRRYDSSNFFIITLNILDICCGTKKRLWSKKKTADAE